MRKNNNEMRENDKRKNELPEKFLCCVLVFLITPLPPAYHFPNPPSPWGRKVRNVSFSVARIKGKKKSVNIFFGGGNIYV